MSSRDRGHDDYGPLPDYHACFRTPGGRCATSGKPQYDGDEGRACSLCEDLGSPPALMAVQAPVAAKGKRATHAQLSLRFEDAS